MQTRNTYDENNMVSIVQYLNDKIATNKNLSTLEALALTTIYMAAISSEINKIDGEGRFKALNQMSFALHEWSKNEASGLGGIKEVLMDLSRLFPYRQGLFEAIANNPEFRNTTPSTKVMSTYIVREVGTKNIKIGKSTNPSSRIKNIESSSGRIVETLKIYGLDIEIELHEKFKKYRRVGEWFFDINDEISNYTQQQT
ncbi:GIY-YIG nuclease family protein [Acinetobacter sp. Ver3]|uniref:GIY-YIG nuclease family protein n=1 Tax=Acinetobacter sp. Ver3 TaxID=466088 RepID=UPI00044810A9|nr:GIY-YIG nuclease family protein [Acinetobacter sp. Ver3]EZQ10780.1 hypothetical protein CL42_06240 [Acinetobacter sp. Ver3]